MVKQHVNLLILPWIFVHLTMDVNSYTNRHLCKNANLLSHSLNKAYVVSTQKPYVVGNQKNFVIQTIFEHTKHLPEIMGKKIMVLNVKCLTFGLTGPMR